MPRVARASATSKKRVVAAVITGPVDDHAGRHYSKELLGSSRARLAFVDADLQPLAMTPGARN